MAEYKKDSCEISQRSIKSFLNNEVKDFAKYVVETRACPSLMDGLRIGARKILWASITGDLKNSTKIKMPSLIGDAMKMHYNHGDASLLNTIVQLCSTHIYKYAPLEVTGQIGTLRVPKCDTAPRYLHVKKSPYLEFFKTDMELLERMTDDGDLVEPKFFLPIIPIVLLWRTNSPGFGFSFRSFSYDLDDIIDNCIKAISFGTCESDVDFVPLKPYVEGVKPENMIYNSNKNAWYNVGEYEMDYNNDRLYITDLPYNVSFEKFDEHLMNLVEKNYIVSFVDSSIDGKMKYIIQFAKGRLKLLEKDSWKFFQNFKLFSKVKKDTLNCIDIDGNTILFFETPQQLIDAFVKKRLTFYQKRKTRTIEVIRKDIQVLNDKIKFIDLVVSGQLVISKRPVKDIKDDLVKFNLSNDMLKLSIEKLTTDEISSMNQKKIELENYLKYILETSIQDMYIYDLIEFKSKYSTIIKK